MKTIVILQARMSSSRLPGKVMAEINSLPMIHWQIRRILRASRINKLVVATSEHVSDDKLAQFLKEDGIEIFRGSLDDVHSRYLKVIQNNPDYDTIVRLTGDCPFTMPKLLDEMIKEFQEKNFEYYSNCNPPTYPDGLDVEVFSRKAFIKLSNKILNETEKEHVTLGFRSPQYNFKIGNKRNFRDDSASRWTVDYAEDLEFARGIFGEFKSREEMFDYADLLKLLIEKPLLGPKLSGTLRNIALKTESET